MVSLPAYLSAPGLVGVLAVLPGERSQRPDDAVPVVGRALEERPVPRRPLRGAGFEFTVMGYGFCN